jgi:hypothetical protein
MQHLVGSGTPVLYIGRTVFKGKKKKKIRVFFKKGNLENLQAVLQ